MAGGRLLVLGAAVLWSLSGLFVKSPPLAALYASSPAMAGPAIACLRALAAGVLLLPAVAWRCVRWRRMLVPLVLSFAAMNVLFVSAMTIGTAGDVIFLQYTAPFWVLAVEVMWLKEPLVRRNLVAALFALLGVAAITHGVWGGGQMIAALLALGAGAAYAGVILCLRVLRQEDSAWLVAVAHLAGGFVLLPWVAAGGVALRPAQWGLVIGMGVVQMGLPYLLVSRGLRRLRAQEVAILTLFEPVLNPVWVLLAWGEPIEPHTIAGGALILSGLLVRYAPLARRRAGAEQCK